MKSLRNHRNNSNPERIVRSEKYPCFRLYVHDWSKPDKFNFPKAMLEKKTISFLILFSIAVIEYDHPARFQCFEGIHHTIDTIDRKSTRLNSSHSQISYA